MTLIGSAVTLVLGAVVAVVLLGLADVPSDYFSSDFLRVSTLALAAAAAPVALLVAWGEIDLSSLGTVAVGGHIYAELSEDGVVPALVVAAVVGVAVGLAVGGARWLSGAHSALVSLAAAAVTAGVVLMLSSSPGPSLAGGRIDGVGLPILVMVATTGLAVGLAILFSTVGAVPSAGSPAGAAGSRVVPAFALSGMAASCFGALMAGSQGANSFGYGADVRVLVLVFTAVAVGGVVRGSGPVAPLAAALGALVVVLIQDATLFHNWDLGSDQVALGGLLVVCLLVANVLRRILTPSRPRTQF
jgi:ribose/xylose/arabinose/galactoside ABC-type transport system permease subunit